MKNISLFIWLFFGMSFLYSQNNPLTILEDSYKYESIDSFEIFLTKWEIESHSIKPNELIFLSSDLRNIYSIYSSFIEFIDNESDTTISKYIIIQNTLFFEFDEILFDTTTYTHKLNIDSIVDFKPNISLKNRKILHSSSIYFKTINIFLNSPISEENDNPKINGLNSNKKKWIDSFDKFYIFSGNKFVIYPYPFVKNIIINKERNTARIEYQINHSSGYAILKKEKNKWKVVCNEVIFDLN